MKRIYLIAAAALFLTVVAFVQISFQMGKKSAENSANKKSVIKEEITGEMNSLSDGYDFTKDTKTAIEISEEEILKKGDIAWQEPVNIGDIGMTKKEVYEINGYTDQESGIMSNGIKYVKVGKIVSGKYRGADLINIASCVYEGIGGCYDIFRIIKSGDNVTFISKEIDEYQKNLISKVYLSGNFKVIFNDKIVIEELSYPDEIAGIDESWKKLKKKGDRNPFFYNKELKMAFKHPIYGDVWMTDDYKAESGDSMNIDPNSYYMGTESSFFRGGGFYIKRPDGTATVYALSFDIFSSSEDGGSRSAVLDATWNDGIKNIDEYEYVAAGCGSSAYVYDMTSNVNLKDDLQLIGKTSKGDNLYGFKNLNHPEFLRLYNEIYWAQEGEVKKSKEDFLKIYPEVFWVDQFGRILAMYNTNIISPAECGKPVIYLYPESSMEVSVKVSPDLGLSVSDPDYGNGWRVFSDEKSNILNYSDGKTYPYLFWEGASSELYEMPEKGFVVASANLDSFLSDKLKELGLQGKEINDFKEFWVPKVLEENKPYYFITFLGNRFMDKVAPLQIEPKPDTVIRIFMDYEGLDSDREVEGFSVKTPERKGFTVVEWGGMLK